MGVKVYQITDNVTFFKSLFRLIKRSQCFTLLTLFAGKPLLTSRSPPQEASNAENVTMPSRHFVTRANTWLVTRANTWLHMRPAATKSLGFN